MSDDTKTITRTAQRLAWLETMDPTTAHVAREALGSIGQRQTTQDPQAAAIATLEARVTELECEVAVMRADRAVRDREMCDVLHAMVNLLDVVVEHTGSMAFAEVLYDAPDRLSPPEVEEAMGGDLEEGDIDGDGLMLVREGCRHGADAHEIDGECSECGDWRFACGCPDEVER